jgi:hypothetical protein
VHVAGKIHRYFFLQVPVKTLLVKKWPEANKDLPAPVAGKNFFNYYPS